MREATTEDLRQLAAAWEPVLFFADGERFFPIQAESWLGHVSQALWSGRYTPGAAIDTEREHHRGTAVMRADPARDEQGTVVPGRWRPPGSSEGTPPYATGSPPKVGTPAHRHPQASGDLYLTFGGWTNAGCTVGNEPYLYAAFSNLSAAMEQRNEWLRFDEWPSWPLMWAEQPTTPTVYAEIEWAGAYVETEAQRGALGASERDAADLRRMLALTYHYLFPMREASGAAAGSRALEGQWEAVTIFLRGTPLGTRRNGREAFAIDETLPLTHVREPPDAAPGEPSPASFEAVAVVLGRPPMWSAESWRDRSVLARTAIASGHPALAVGKGTHRMYFAPVGGEATSFAEEVHGQVAADTRLDERDPGRGDVWWGDWWEDGAFVGGLGGLGSWPLAPVAIPVMLVIWAVSKLLGLGNEVDAGELAPRRDASEPRGDGGGPVSWPADAAAPGTVKEVPVRYPDGTSGTRVVRVDDPATTILRLVSRYHPVAGDYWQARPDGVAPPTHETPPWWDFAGRWGVLTPEGAAWEPGSHRAAPDGRSPGFENARQLVVSWAAGTAPRPRP